MSEQETTERIEFIHSEVKVDIETVKTNPDAKANVFLTRGDKIDLIIRIDITKSDLIDRMKVDSIDRRNKVKTDLIYRTIAYPCCSQFY